MAESLLKKFDDRYPTNDDYQSKFLQEKVWQLIQFYRDSGERYANLDPLHMPGNSRSCLKVEAFELDSYRDTEFFLNPKKDSKKITLTAINDMMRRTYWSEVYFEFSHLDHDKKEYSWLVDTVEATYLKKCLSSVKRKQILKKLIEAEELEFFLHKKYPNKNRYSGEGMESLVPAIDRLVKSSGKYGVTDLYFGMQHRGRLNVLVNVFGKSLADVYDDFEDKEVKKDFVTTDDVIFHHGYKCKYRSKKTDINITLAHNPSHLEIVNPIVAGMVRAKQDRKLMQNKKVKSVLGVILHGDAALSGLGVNYSLFNSSFTKSYNVGGMIHIVVNNQIGRTTDIVDARSSSFCTDIAKPFKIPIIHVNANNIESVIFSIDLAIKYRQMFSKDIVIDLIGFRRRGHEELEDPTLTQPRMYKKIEKNKGVCKLYGDLLVKDNIIKKDFIDKYREKYRRGLDKKLHININNIVTRSFYDESNSYFGKKKKYKTSIAVRKIEEIVNQISRFPDLNFSLHNTVLDIFTKRSRVSKDKSPIDFGMAEVLAFGSLLQMGINIRLVGEDSCRGVFNHRHAVLYNQKNQGRFSYVPLKNLENKSTFSIYNSLLNEECALGFEYGYSTINLNDLVIWEAYSGDFANSAQVIIDQFIAAGKAKWGQLNNLTLFLPHGFDGGGPEHSSARIERYLQLCAEQNLDVVQVTTPAQLFHILRKKVLSLSDIKPLIIFIPKLLLQKPIVASSHHEIVKGKFNQIICENHSNYDKIKKIVLCSGKIYYHILEHKMKHPKFNDVGLIRIEQLFPFPVSALKKELVKYKNVDEYIWAQEEPYNQGACMYIREHLISLLPKYNIKYVARKSTAAPACANAKRQNRELHEIIRSIFYF